MKIYDISQRIFSCRVYPGDPRPERQILSDMGQGQLYNLTGFSMCAHNGTHIDAPFHFFRDGKTVDQLPPETFAGDCLVVRQEGAVDAPAAEEILGLAAGISRILIAGDATVTASGARVFAGAGVKLLGNESQTVGPEDGPMEVHKILLGQGVALLEGLVLEGVPQGKYLLCALPLNLEGSDGAPCRAVLMEL